MVANRFTSSAGVRCPRTMHGTVARPISFRHDAAVAGNDYPPRIDQNRVVKPNSTTLATIWVTCAGEWVRAFFAYGISALTGRCSIAEATIGSIINLF